MKKARILLIGINGRLGWELQRTCATLGEIVTADFPELNLAHPKKLGALLKNIQPDMIINAAAYTNMDQAETEIKLARKVNALSPGVLAQYAARHNIGLIHYSTDYVFDGQKGSSYLETDIPNPINTYGTTMLEGEQTVHDTCCAYFIFRTSWVYSLRQGGFVNKVMKWAREQKILRVVDDQISNPTWARMLAEATAQVIAQGDHNLIHFMKEHAGLYHLAGSGEVTRYEWARRILALDPKMREHVMEELKPAKTIDFPTAAVRPRNTTLNMQRFEETFNITLPHWDASLQLAMSECSKV
ncbi:MAG: dTDP-4-dehydrorhamnose reductase [Anaerolineaceae bacterium]|nr:dTDP-4-dehydrorhamnose reductase [Anaerolineaceae bacterium]